MQSRRRIIHMGAFPKFSFCNDKVGDSRSSSPSVAVSFEAYVNAYLIVVLYFYEHAEVPLPRRETRDISSLIAE